MKQFLPIAALCGTTLVLAHCGGSYDYPAPTSPTAAVEAFLNAVRADSHLAMGRLWGSSNGPAVSYMDPTVLEQRLTIMQLYLDHESYEIVQPNAPAMGDPGSTRPVIQVKLERGGCSPVVPFTMVRYRDGWLVWEVDIEAAGNPARMC